MPTTRKATSMLRGLAALDIVRRRHAAPSVQGHTCHCHSACNTITSMQLNFVPEAESQPAATSTALALLVTMHQGGVLSAAAQSVAACIT